MDTASCYTEVQMREGEMEWGWHYPKNLNDSLVSVSRRNDRVMSVKLGTHIQNMGYGG